MVALVDLGVQEETIRRMGIKNNSRTAALVGQKGTDLSKSGIIKCTFIRSTPGPFAF